VGSNARAILTERFRIDSAVRRAANPSSKGKTVHFA
jgi:hypothetical protein